MVDRPGSGLPFSFRRLRAVRTSVPEKRPLVLIHGMSAGPEAWDPVVPLLAATRTVHLVTLPGHRGGAPIVDPDTFRSSQYVDAVEAQLDELGLETADLVGNSLGGWIALQLAGRGRATSVVCLSPAGGWPLGGSFDRFLARQFSFAYRLARRMTTQPSGRLLRAPAIRRGLLFGMVARPENVSDEAYLETVASIAACDALKFSIAGPAARDVHWVPRATCPVLIAWGGQDRILIPRRSRRRLAAQVGDPTVVVLPHVGHVPMSDSPELVASTILGFVESAAVRTTSIGPDGPRRHPVVSLDQT